MREVIADILNDDTKYGKYFSWFIQILIIVSLISLGVRTIPDLPDITLKTIKCINIICMLIFVTEYSFRIYTAKRVFKYIFSFYGIVDFLAVMPYFLGLSGMDSSSIKAFRLLRVFQLLKLTRYTKAVKRYHTAFLIAKEELLFFIIVTIIIIYIAGVGIYHFENIAQPEAFSSIFHSIWWAVITLTTVGYGEVYPITVGGKVFTVVILFIGLGIVSVPAGMLASALSEARRYEDESK